jgi:hypothetical protein
MGAQGLPIVEVAAPIGGRTVEENRGSIDACINSIYYALTNVGKITETEERSEPDVITVTGRDFIQVTEKVNELFIEKKWGDGLPLVPPVQQAVDQMLTGTSHSPDEIVGLIEQRKGVATVKVVAINAVMAGCKPDYLPVVLAAVEASTNPAYNLYGVQSTTGHAIPLLVANGPIRDELHINSQSSCMGPGFQANATIGRAFNLVMTSVGGRGVTTMSSFSDPGRFTWCIGENEAELPPGWKPLHVEKGYSCEESTITLMNVQHRTSIIFFFATTPEYAIGKVANAMKYGFSWLAESLLVLLPEVAHLLAEKVQTKDDLRKLLYGSSKVPWKEVKEEEKAKLGLFPPDLVRTLTDDNLVSPNLSSPEDLNIIVAGGAGRHSYFLSPWVSSRTVTISIDKWR